MLNFFGASFSPHSDARHLIRISRLARPLRARVHISVHMCVCLSVHTHVQMISGETEGRFALTGTSDIGIPYAHVQELEELERFGHFGARAGREGRCVPDAPPVLTAATAAVKAPCS